MASYDISTDTDLNKYESDDIKDLTLANIGEAGRETAVNMTLIVILLIITFVVGVLLGLKRKAGQFAK